MQFSGLAKASNGDMKLIVAGGKDGGTYYELTRVLDLQTLEWTTGQPLPHNLYLGQTVQYKSTFLLFGGYTSSGDFTAIYEYEPDTGAWITRPETLPAARRGFAAFLVPDTAVNCY